MQFAFRRRSLRLKIIGWSVIPTVIILIVVALLNAYAFRRVTEDLVFDRDRELTALAAGQLSLQLSREPDLMVLVSAYSVYRNDPAYQNMISNVVGGVLKLRAGSAGSAYLVDQDGRVIYHTEGRYVGTILGTQVAVQRVTAGQQGALRTFDPDGREIVASFAPVPGTSWGLVNQESWAALSTVGQTYRQVFFLLLALVLLVPVVVIALGVRQITRPLERLTDAAGQIARGNFDQRIQVSTGDNLEELAEQFNRMAINLQESYAYLEQRVADRTRELQTLNAIAAVLSEPAGSAEMLDRALGMLMDALNMEVGEIRLWEGEHGLVVRAQRGDVPDLLPLTDMAEMISPQGEVVQPGEPVVVEDTYGYRDRQAWREGLRALALLPLSAREHFLGVLVLATRRGPRPFSPEERSLLHAVSDQLGLAVENVRLQAESRQRAIVEERNRLARDLHDSVAQALYGVTLYAEATARHLAAGDLAQAAEHLQVLRETAQESLREMRLLVFELRPSVLLQEGLAGALQSRLDAVEGRGGLVTEFHSSGSDRLPPEVEEGLYFVAREALNNVLRHACARRVWVSLVWDEERVVLEIGDDGVGFDPASARPCGGLGLRSMEERAARLGGRLKVDSSPGRGTLVRLEVG